MVVGLAGQGRGPPYDPAVGTLVDPRQLADGLPWLAAFLVLIVAAKVGVAYLLARYLVRLTRPFQLAVGLGQIGEFSFVLATALAASGTIPAPIYVALVAAVAVPIAASAVAVRLEPAWRFGLRSRPAPGTAALASPR